MGRKKWVSLVLILGSLIGFQVGVYDRRHPLTIDAKYWWHTFYGLGSRDVANIA